ncbi:D-aminoacyl-tRNA deacylase [Streptomyces sp. M19]
MRAVVQRVDGASVAVEGETVGEIVGEGLCVLVGVTHDDTPERLAAWRRSCGRCGSWREKSCSDIGAPLLVISQFTLYGDARRAAAHVERGGARRGRRTLVAEVVARLRALGAHVETGRFGARMRVGLTNDGPFTVLIEV